MSRDRQDIMYQAMRYAPTEAVKQELRQHDDALWTIGRPSPLERYRRRVFQNKRHLPCAEEYIREKAAWLANDVGKDFEKFEARTVARRQLALSEAALSVISQAGTEYYYGVQ